jgi:hypothetical protein
MELRDRKPRLWYVEYPAEGDDTVRLSYQVTLLPLTIIWLVTRELHNYPDSLWRLIARDPASSILVMCLAHFKYTTFSAQHAR